MSTLLDARMHGRLADNIFFPSSIHPDLRAMLNPEYLRRFGLLGKRKRDDNTTGNTPKKARILDPAPILDEGGFGDGGFGIGNDGFDGGFGDTHEGGFGDTNDGGFGDVGFTHDGDTFDKEVTPARTRTVSPSLVGDEVVEEEEVPTSLTGSLSHSTITAAHHLASELSPHPTTKSFSELTVSATHGQGVRREDAVKMFFEVLVLASRDVIGVKQRTGFGEIEVRGKEGLFKQGAFAGPSQPVVVS
jgi:hypothetical protein